MTVEEHRVATLTDMGSGASRGKRVAPARVSEAHAISRVNARNRDRSSSSNSASPRGGDTIDGDADTAAADERDQSWACVKRSPSSQKEEKEKKKKKSRSYGLCRSRQEEEESSSEEPRGPRDVNNRAFLHVRKQTDAPSAHVTAFLSQDAAPLEAVPTAERKPTLSQWQNSSLTPVILYDGSEEELMDTIEREFS